MICLSVGSFKEVSISKPQNIVHSHLTMDDSPATFTIFNISLMTYVEVCTSHNSLEIIYSLFYLFKMEAHADLKTGTSGMKESEKSLHAAAVGLFTLPHLQSLELEGVCLDDAFFEAMTSAAPHAQVLVYRLAQSDMSEAQ